MNTRLWTTKEKRRVNFQISMVIYEFVAAC